MTDFAIKEFIIETHDSSIFYKTQAYLTSLATT
jgi:hypothetical protein